VDGVDGNESRPGPLRIEEWFAAIGEQLPTGMRDELRRCGCA
jgi:hypothetical protein